MTVREEDDRAPRGVVDVEVEPGNKFVPEFDRLLGSWSFTEVQASPLACLSVSKMEFNFSKVPNGEDGAEYRTESAHSLTFCFCLGENSTGSGQAKVDEVTGQLATRIETPKGVGLVYMTSQGNGKFSTFTKGQSGTITIVGPNKYIMEFQNAKISMERS